MTSTDTSSSSSLVMDRRRTWGFIAAVAIVLLLVGSWVTQPGAFADPGNTVGYAPADRVAQQRIHLDTGISPDRPVHVISIAPVYDQAPEDVADRVTFHRCSAAAVGVVGADLTSYCPSPQDVEGDLLGPDDQVVLGLTVDDTAIRIDGFVVTYRSGIRFGRQHTGNTVEFTPAE